MGLRFTFPVTNRSIHVVGFIHSATEITQQANKKTSPNVIVYATVSYATKYTANSTQPVTKLTE